MLETKNKKSLDIAYKNKIRKDSFDLPLAKYVIKKKKSSVLFCPKWRTDKFFTHDSKLYLTQDELLQFRQGKSFFNLNKRLDSLVFRKDEKNLIYSAKPRSDIYFAVSERYSSIKNYILDFIQGSTQGVSVSKMWNISIVGSIIFGMCLMTMVYRYLGQGALAKSKDSKKSQQQAMVLGDGDSKEEDYKPDPDETNYIYQILEQYGKEKEEDKKNEAFEEEMRKMVKGYPIEKMVPFIAKKDKAVAAFLIGIAKKESDWGKHVPVLKGEDCYNYWGYRGKRDRMGTGGHTCFNSPEDAVNTVAKRLEFLVSDEKVNTPSKMVVVWKCGYDCSWDNPSAVKKWISDVDQYFRKLDKVEK